MMYKATGLHKEYCNLFGEPKTPDQVADFYVFAARKSGRTTTMINALPDEPCAIVVHSYTFGKALLDIIKRNRPNYNHKNIRFITQKKINDEPNTLAGLNIPIYVDNAVIDVLAGEYVDNLNAKYGPRPKIIDTNQVFWNDLMQAASESTWIPKEEYLMNDIVADICNFLRTGKGIL